MDRGDHQAGFSGREEDVRYWKELAERLMQEKEYVQREFDDYTAESQQLEKEYEVTIEQNEKTIKELRSTNGKLQNEVESLRLKVDKTNKENALLQTDITTLVNEKLQLTRYVRELEQKNDDLERSERAIGESIAAIETALNLAIERNAMLESEIDEKESLKEKLQRLADEARDLKQELQVKEKERCPDNERRLNGFCATPPPPPPVQMDSNRLHVENETQTTPFKREPLLYGEMVYDDHSIMPSQKVMALNIVGQILRKVGGLESRLNQRSYYHDSRNRTRLITKGTPPPAPPSPVHEQTK